MAAPRGNQNGLGNKGGGAPTVVDRKLSQEVRRLTLNKIKALLEMPEVKMKQDDYELYKAVLIKLAGSVLPRINEGSGENGEFIVQTITGTVIKKDDTDIQNKNKPTD